MMTKDSTAKGMGMGTKSPSKLSSVARKVAGVRETPVAPSWLAALMLGEAEATLPDDPQEINAVERQNHAEIDAVRRVREAVLSIPLAGAPGRKVGLL